MSYLHDASPTWNGFNYQGKVALISVLDKMLELHDSSMAWESYSLELEWLEDFSIKRGGDYISIHQVKNYGTNSLNSYKSAIHSLLSKLLNTISSNELRNLITDRVSHDTKTSIAESIFEHLKAIDVITNNSTVNKESIIESIDLPEEISNQLKKPNEFLTRLKDTLGVYKVIYNSCNDLEAAYLHIAEPLTPNFSRDDVSSLDNIQDSELSKIDGFNNALGNLSVYEYEGDIFHCANGDVDNYLNNKIQEYFMAVNSLDEPNPKCQINYLNKVRIRLLALIDTHISERHQAIRNGEQGLKLISFVDFQNLLDQNLEENLYYDAWKLKELYNATLYSYLEEINTETEKCDLLLNLTDNILEKYSGERFIDFCFKIRPHALSPEIKQSLLNQTDLRDAFFRFFYLASNYDEDIHVKDKSSNEYSLITTINERDFDIESRKMSVYQQIKKNQKNLPPYTFNVKRLVGRIGEGNGGENYSDVVQKDTTASKEFQVNNNAIDRSKKITISDDFTIVDIQDEITRLNSNDND